MYPITRFTKAARLAKALPLGMAACMALPVDSQAGDASVVEKMPGLVAFWTFGEDGRQQPRLSQGTKEKHPLQEHNGPIPRSKGGPFSGYSALLSGNEYFFIPHEKLGDLNICGPDAQVTMFAVVRVDDVEKSRTIAGIWTEGAGYGDDSGTRQWALLLHMPAYGGHRRVVPHISAEGGVTMRADGSKLPWNADYASSVSEVPEGRWCTMGFTYDSKWVRAYLNGIMEPRELDPEKDHRTDRYFTKEGPNGGGRGMNPYYHGRGIFKYDPVLHATKLAPADFTVGARHAGNSMFREAFRGKFGALAIFNRALTDEEMKALHDAAAIETIEP